MGYGGNEGHANDLTGQPGQATGRFGSITPSPTSPTSPPPSSCVEKSMVGQAWAPACSSQWAWLFSLGQVRAYAQGRPWSDGCGDLLQCRLMHTMCPVHPTADEPACQPQGPWHGSVQEHPIIRSHFGLAMSQCCRHRAVFCQDALDGNATRQIQRSPGFGSDGRVWSHIDSSSDPPRWGGSGNLQRWPGASLGQSHRKKFSLV
jgi:hypothetical protein